MAKARLSKYPVQHTRFDADTAWHIVGTQWVIGIRYEIFGQEWELMAENYVTGERKSIWTTFRIKDFRNRNREAMTWLLKGAEA